MTGPATAVISMAGPTSASGPALASAGAVQIPVVYPFWFGGSASSMAACVTHPLDLVKVRLQTQTGSRLNMVGMFVHVAQTGGIGGLYKGISASLLRQLTYSTARFGVYEQLKQRLSADSRDGGASGATRRENATPGFATLVGMASISGLIGGIAGNPADVLNVRMQHDAALPADQRREYKNVVDGLVRMTREEGISSLFRGLGPNCARAVLMTTSQLATYDQFKSVLRTTIGMSDGLGLHFSASILAGFVATTVCSPFDVIKTRVMSSSSIPESRLKSGLNVRHSSTPGLVNVIKSITKAEGLGWMFRGWMPSFIRLGPQTVFTFLFLEQHKKWYRSARSGI